jgi:hypothetical protein
VFGLPSHFGWLEHQIDAWQAMKLRQLLEFSRAHGEHCKTQMIESFSLPDVTKKNGALRLTCL